MEWHTCRRCESDMVGAMLEQDTDIQCESFHGGGWTWQTCSVGSRTPAGGKHGICSSQIFGNKLQMKWQEIYGILHLYRTCILLKVCDNWLSNIIQHSSFVRTAYWRLDSVKWRDQVQSPQHCCSELEMMATLKNVNHCMCSVKLVQLILNGLNVVL